MAMPYFLRTTLRQTVYLAARSGVSAAGDPVWGAAAAKVVRQERIQKRITNALGEEIMATAHLIFKPEDSVGQNDRIWLEGDSSSSANLARVPIQVNRAVDENGELSHWEVYL